MIEEIDKLETYFYHKFSQVQALSSPLRARKFQSVDLPHDDPLLDFQKIPSMTSPLRKGRGDRLDPEAQASYR